MWSCLLLAAAWGAQRERDLHGLRTEALAAPVGAGLATGPDGQCQILSGAYAVSIQALLCMVTVTLLLFKWWREAPRRDFQVFLLDGSKQLVGAGWAHAFNLVAAVVLAKNLEAGDECSWYWVNIMVDTTLGTLICYGLLKLSTRCGGYESGRYLTPEGTLDATKWIPQVAVWCVIVTCMKAIAGLLIVLAQRPLDALAGAVLGHLGAEWKLLVVMVVTPGVMNAVQFWVQDSFLMWRSGLAFSAEGRSAEDDATAPLAFSAEGRASAAS